jgi:hypothetical protein
VVLDVAGPALGIRDEGVRRSLALELAQDRRVAAADRVHRDVQAPAVGDPDDDLVRALLGAELDRLVEHRDQRVEALDRELLLPEERPPKVGLEGLDLRQPLEQRPPLLALEGLAKAPGLDRPAEPDALGVVRDVLDLVRQRPRVHLAEPR